MDLRTFHQNLTEDLPDHVAEHPAATKRYNELIQQATAVIDDQAAGILIDTRPAALAALRQWEDRIKDNSVKEESLDKKDANKQWREWARMSAAEGAGKAHRWTKVPTPWRPKTASTNNDHQDALPQAILEDLKKN